MFAAELKGKLPGEIQRMEDVLTSYFFGVMKNLAPDLMLCPWLKSLGLEIEPWPGSNVSYSFWEALTDGTEPDMIIRTADNLIMVEVKYLSTLGADKTQLIREVEGGLALSEKEHSWFNFIALTNDFQKPSALIQLERDYPPEEYGYRCIWASWRRAFELVEELIVNAGEYRPWLEDLLEAMLKRGLKGFRGFAGKEGRILESIYAINCLNDIGLDISNLYKELDLLLDDFGFSPVQGLANTVARDGASRNLNEPQTWIPTYFARVYTKNKGEIDTEDVFYFVKIRLDEEEPQFAIGASMIHDEQQRRPFLGGDANGFFLSLRDGPLEPVDSITERVQGGLLCYKLLDRLVLLRSEPLVDIRKLEALSPIAGAFTELRKAVSLARRTPLETS